MILLEQKLEQMTLEEFVRLFDQEGPFELINGERRALMPTVAGHNWMIRLLFRLIDQFCTGTGLGEVFFEQTFVLLYHSDWVKGSRTPDLLFISAARWAQYVQDFPDWEGKPIVLVPDLVIEVVSPNDSYSEMDEKVERYLADGVRLIWVVDPSRARVGVYEGDSYRRLTQNDTLIGGSVLPELAIPLNTVFQVQA